LVTINDEVELDLYTQPEPEPEPDEEVTEIETTEGVTREEIALLFMELPPISIKVRFDEHVPFGERKIA